MKRIPEMAARTARDLGKSCGCDISEMKLGKRIWGTQRKDMLRRLFMLAILLGCWFLWERWVRWGEGKGLPGDTG